MRRSSWFPVLLVIVLLAAGCGGEEAEPELSAEPPEETAQEPTTTTSTTTTSTTTTEGDATTSSTQPATTSTAEAGGTTTSATSAPLRTIEVIETEFDLQTPAVPGNEEPLTVTLDQAGTYTFRAVNEGSIVHALQVEGEGVEAVTEDIQPGQSAELTVTLQPGTYDLYCPIANHKQQGMDGQVDVAGG